MLSIKQQDKLTYEDISSMIRGNPLLTHFLTHMTARGRDRLPQIAKIVAYYKRYEFVIIRGYGRLFGIAND